MDSGNSSAPQRVAICLVSDAGYAFPSAVVAKSAAEAQSERLGPVYFVWADDASPPREFESYLAQAGVVLARAPKSLLRPYSGATSGRLTRGSLARLFLSQTLEREAIGRFIYLDSDVEITGSLDPLAAIPLAAGEIAAADDVRGVVFRKPHLEAQLRRERSRLGLPDSAGYFNAGVIVADMRDWAEISAAALEFFASDPSACPFMDQCALNAVCRDRRRVLSPLWNFQSPYFRLALEDEIRPGIVHFTGPHKPWVPIPFTRTWRARKLFLAARERMPQLFKITQPRVLPRGYYTRPLTKRLGGSAARRERERREFFAYLARTEFIDAPAIGTSAR